MDYKSYFEIPDHITYLNTPGNGLMPRTHYDWRKKREVDFFDLSSNLRDQQPDFIAGVKSNFAKLFNCDISNIYALPNFSFGLQTLLDGLPNGLKYGILNEDYPSLNYPIISRNLDFVSIDIAENLEDNIEDTIKKYNINVLLLSVVQYINGMIIDLDFIKNLKSKFPDLLIFGDATQYFGTAPFDFKASGFDAIGGSGYKWLMAGFGNGYLMISNRMKEILYQQAQSGSRPTVKMWESKSILDTFFEPGHQDTLAHGTLLQSVRFLSNIGLENVKDYLTELKDYAYLKLEERDLILPEIKNRKHKSSLINVQINPDYYNLLMENGVKCFPRGSGIRIGLHLYNTKKDIDKLLEVIDNIK